MTNSYDLPFGIDVSRYQGVIDWDVIAAHEPKVEFVGIRAAISWGYKDTYLDHNWAEAKRVKIPRAAYHVFYPGEDPKRQMDHFIACLNGDMGELPLALDCELDHDVPYATISKNIASAAYYLETVTECKPIIYTRANWVDQYITGNNPTHWWEKKKTPPTWLAAFDFWLAQYLLNGEEHSGPPTLPGGVSRNQVVVHQTSGSGEPFGVESGALDYNRWQFEKAHLDVYAGRNGITPVHDDDPEQDWGLLLDEARDCESCAEEAYLQAQVVRKKVETLLAV